MNTGTPSQHSLSMSLGSPLCKNRYCIEPVLHSFPIFWLICLSSLISTPFQVSFQPSVGIIQPFICRVTYIQPYCASECIDIGFTKLTFQPYYASKMLIYPYFNPMISQNSDLLTLLWDGQSNPLGICLIRQIS